MKCSWLKHKLTRLKLFVNNTLCNSVVINVTQSDIACGRTLPYVEYGPLYIAIQRDYLDSKTVYVYDTHVVINQVFYALPPIICEVLAKYKATRSMNPFSFKINLSLQKIDPVLVLV